MGAWLGLFALSFPAALLLVPVAGVLFWLRFRRPAPALLGVAAALLAIAPATLLNAWRSGEWIAISAHGGVTLAQGNGPASIGIYTPLPDVGQHIEDQHTDAARAFERAHGRAGSWHEIDGWFRSRAVDWWLDHPVDAARLLLEKLRWLATARRYDNVATFAFKLEQDLTDVDFGIEFAVSPDWQSRLISLADLEAEVDGLTFPEVMHDTDQSAGGDAERIAAAARTMR